MSAKTKEAVQAHKAWLKRPKSTYAREPHGFRCKCQGCHCPTCNTEYYWSANSGCYGCRNSACPPGKESAYQSNLAKGERLLVELRNVHPAKFASVEDLAYVVRLCGESVPLPSGKHLANIKARLR